MRSTIRLILVAALGAASVSAETAYRIDIGRTDRPLLKTGYTALTTQFSSAGGSMTIDGDLFQVAGNLGSRLRTVGGLGGGAPDNLTADFAFANTGMITITLGSAGVSAYRLFIRDAAAAGCLNDTIRLNGIGLTFIAVPEPSTAMLGGLALPALLPRRR